MTEMKEYVERQHTVRAQQWNEGDDPLDCMSAHRRAGDRIRYKVQHADGRESVVTPGHIVCEDNMGNVFLMEAAMFHLKYEPREDVDVSGLIRRIASLEKTVADLANVVTQQARVEFDDSETRETRAPRKKTRRKTQTS